MNTTHTPPAAELEPIADALASALLRALNLVIHHTEQLVASGAPHAAAREAAIERIATRWPHLGTDVRMVLGVIDGLEAAR